MNQLTLIDKDGHTLKEEGMGLARDKADRAEPGWSDQAAKYLTRFLYQWPLPDFTGEEAQVWMVREGLPRPASSNAWGSVFNSAARRGLIKKTGQYRNSQKPSARSRAIPVWRKS